MRITVPFALDEHIDRLINSAAFIEMNLRHTREEIAELFGTGSSQSD
ncbi:MAG: hypothetical protein ACLT16_19250 [[Clostridium] innocuum]